MSTISGPKQVKMIRVSAVSTNLGLYVAKTQSTTPTLSTFVISSKTVNTPVLPTPIIMNDITPAITLIKSELEVENEVEIETDHSLPQILKKLAPCRSAIGSSYPKLKSSPRSSSSTAVRLPKSKTVADILKQELLNSSGKKSPPAAPDNKKQTFTRIRNKRLQYCRLCDRGFKSHDTLVKHFLIEHPDVTRQEDMYEDPWRCMYCNSWFDGPRRLSYHVKSFHKDALSVKDAVIDNQPQLVECKICGAVLKSSLIKHTLKAHANELDEGTSDIVKDPRRCPICGKMCSGEQGIRHHLLRTHGSMTADKDFQKANGHHLTNPDPLPVLGRRLFKRPSTDLSSDYNVKRPFTSDPDDQEEEEEEEDTFQIVEEEQVISDECSISQSSTNAFDEPGGASYCDICQMDLLNAELFGRHVELRHKPIPCPLCTTPIVWCKGQIGLDAHDEAAHHGALRLKRAQTIRSS